MQVLAHFETVTHGMARPSEPEACWVWEMGLNSNGYGKLSVWLGGTWYAHRLAYGVTYGEVPAELDHLCHNRACWRPSHLESVTHRENLERSPFCRPTETCQHGHRWDEVGWYVRKDGSRKCKECNRRTARESATRARARRG